MGEGRLGELPNASGLLGLSFQKCSCGPGLQVSVSGGSSCGGSESSRAWPQVGWFPGGLLGARGTCRGLDVGTRDRGLGSDPLGFGPDSWADGGGASGSGGDWVGGWESGSVRGCGPCSRLWPAPPLPGQVVLGGGWGRGWWHLQSYWGTRGRGLAQRGECPPPSTPHSSKQTRGATACFRFEATA